MPKLIDQQSITFLKKIFSKSKTMCLQKIFAFFLALIVSLLNLVSPSFALGKDGPPDRDCRNGTTTVQIKDLTGKWNANDGGAYYLRQLGSTTLWWYGENNNTSPSFSNVFMGSITPTEFCRGEPAPQSAGEIVGNWSDVPKGRNLGSGNLQLRIEFTGSGQTTNNRIVSTSKTGGFGGSIWSRSM